MLKRLISVAFLSVASFASPGSAADIAALSWNGEFIASEEGTVSLKNAILTKDSEALTVELVLESFQAGADGGKSEASSSFSGQFVVLKPQNVKLPTINATIHGHVVKTAGSTARVDILIGGVKKTIEWKSGDVKAGSFVETMSITAADRQLVEPVPVSAIIFVNNQAGTGAVLISIEKIDVKVTEANSVASLSPAFAH
jgi:hypothetical protein